MSDEAKSLVPVQAPGDMLASWGFGDLSARYYCTLAGVSPAARQKKLQLLQSEALPLADQVGKTLRVAAYLYQPGKTVNADTGEEVAVLITKILTVDGQIFKAASVGVVKSLAEIHQEFGPPDQATPYVVLVKQVTTKPPRKMLQLELLKETYSPKSK